MKAKQITEKSSTPKSASKQKEKSTTSDKQDTTPTKQKEKDTTPDKQVEKETTPAKPKDKTSKSKKKSTRTQKEPAEEAIQTGEKEKETEKKTEGTAEKPKKKKKVLAAQKPHLRSPKKAIEKASPKPISKQSKYTVRVLKEIMNLQKETRDIIPKAPFIRLCKELAVETGMIEGVRFTRGALHALQGATEAYIMKLFSDTDLCAEHRRIGTIKVKDMILARKLRGEIL